jgi:two-component system, OmpR family, phosphate regulon sensor histidine kinase PhoR
MKAAPALVGRMRSARTAWRRGLRRTGALVNGWFGTRPDAREQRTVRGTIVIFAAAALLVATGALVWLGHVATREWTIGANQLLERRANEALALVRAAVSTDMKGAWTTAIVPFNAEQFAEEPPFDLLQETARAFARFPYPESFVLWKNDPADIGRTYAFHRADRRPPWDTQTPTDDPFPVLLQEEPPALRGLVEAVKARATPRSHYAVLEVPIGGVTYQVVAHVLFTPTKPHDLRGFFAFLVNLDWLRAEYFGPLIAQVARIGGDRGLSIAVTDERDQLVAATGPDAPSAPAVRTRFPLVFVDAALARSMSSPIREWTAHVRAVPDSTLFATLAGARRTFLLIALAAAASFLALLITVKADRASLALASMKSDFVAGVTHELKTPVALIRLVGDTLANGRYTSPQTVQEYAAILSEQASRLSGSIDNLLTYARYSGANAASIERAEVEPSELVDDVLRSARPGLEHLSFDVTVDLSPDLPPVVVDRAAVVQAMHNIIDNALKYSTERRALAIRGRASAKGVALCFADRGKGIASQELEHVFERFYRGRNADASGSGLGLAIARRIVQHQGGTITIESEVDAGTEVTIVLPAGGAASAHATDLGTAGTHP